MRAENSWFWMKTFKPNNPPSFFSKQKGEGSLNPSTHLIPITRPHFLSKKELWNQMYFLKWFLRWSRSFSDVAWVSWRKMNRGQELAAILLQISSFSSFCSPFIFQERTLKSGNQEKCQIWNKSGGLDSREGIWELQGLSWGKGELRGVGEVWSWEISWDLLTIVEGEGWSWALNLRGGGWGSPYFLMFWLFFFPFFFLLFTIFCSIFWYFFSLFLINFQLRTFFQLFSFFFSCFFFFFFSFFSKLFFFFFLNNREASLRVIWGQFWAFIKASIPKTRGKGGINNFLIIARMRTEWKRWKFTFIWITKRGSVFLVLQASDVLFLGHYFGLWSRDSIKDTFRGGDTLDTSGGSRGRDTSGGRRGRDTSGGGRGREEEGGGTPLEFLTLPLFSFSVGMVLEIAFDFLASNILSVLPFNFFLLCLTFSLSLSIISHNCHSFFLNLNMFEVINLTASIKTCQSFSFGNS